MHPDTERLIELAIRPLADNEELRMSAEKDLRTAVEARGADGDQKVKDAVAALERSDRHPKRAWWGIALIVVTLVVSLPLIFHTARQLNKVTGVTRMISAAGPAGTTPANPARIPNLTPAQQLLLYGDESAGDTAARWKPLWDSAPDDPVYLVRYAGAWFEQYKELSPEILDAAERIDPDNGWFLAKAASANLEKVVTRGKRSTREAKEGKASPLTLHDEALLDERLDLLHRAAAKPRLTSYQAEFLRRQISLIPPRTDLMSQIPLMVQAASDDPLGISLRTLPDAFAAGAEQCAAAGDVEGFRKIIRDWQALAEHSLAGSDSIVDLLVAKATVTFPAPNFRDAARTLGLEEEARHFSDLDERARGEKAERELRRRADDRSADLFKQRGSIFGGLTAPMLGRQVRNPPSYTEDELRAARYADHAILGRMLSGLCWTLLLLWIPLFVVGYRNGPLVTPLSRRMTDLLRPSDWILILTGGVILPTLWYLTISRWSPFSAREWSIAFLAFIPTTGQFISFWLSLLVVPWVIARGILKRRGAVFGLAPTLPWLGWLAAAAVLAGVPAFGAIGPKAGSGPLIYAPTLLLLAGLVACSLAFLLAPKESRALRRATLSRMLLPAGVAGMLVSALLVPLHYAEEKYWIQQDRWSEITPEAPALSRHEYEVSQILRKETRELLGELP